MVMNINLRFANWLRDYMDNANFLSEMEDYLMTKAKKRVPTDEAYEEARFNAKDKDEIIKALDELISKGLDELDLKKKSNWDLVFSLMPAPILHEIYVRLEEGSKAIEENKRIKASLDTVNEAIKKMFKLV